jgi:hypothetical protein
MARPAKRARTGTSSSSSSSSAPPPPGGTGASRATPRATPTAALVAHLEAQGARFGPALRFCASRPGAGVGGFAARNIERGETVCALPLHLAVTSTQARLWWYRNDDSPSKEKEKEKEHEKEQEKEKEHEKEHEKGKKEKKEKKEKEDGGGGAPPAATGAAAAAQEPAFVDDEFLLCMYLIAARRGTASVPLPVRLYAAALSRVAPDTCSWDAVSRRRLRGSVAKATAIAREEAVQWAGYCQGMWAAAAAPGRAKIKTRIAGGAPSFEDILWARGHCKSRRFPETLVKEEAAESANSHTRSSVRYALLPGLDLLNHSNDPGVMEWVTDWEKQLLEFRALADVAEGSEVFNHYGPKSNTSLLFNHGFALANNPNDVYEARLMMGATPAVAAAAVAGDAVEEDEHRQSPPTPTVLWEGKFTGSEEHLPTGLLEQFAEEMEGGEGAEEGHSMPQLYVSAEAIQFLLSWLGALVGGLAKRGDVGGAEEDEEEEEGGGNGTASKGSVLEKDTDLQREWIGYYEGGQRRVLQHVQGLIRSLLGIA